MSGIQHHHHHHRFILLLMVILSWHSDAPGKHNFELLKKLVLPDGSVLRARLPGRPTVDCLFTDPARDGVRSYL